MPQPPTIGEGKEDLLSSRDAEPSVIGAPNAPNIASVLNRAADLLEPPGRWCRREIAVTKSGGYANTAAEAYAVCIVGAIKIAAGCPLRAGLDDLSRRAVDAVEAVIRPGASLSAWNDAQARKRPVIAALRKAAAIAKATAQ